MPAGDEAILRRASGLWAESPAIGWRKQFRDVLSASARRAKELGFEANAPAAGRVVAIIVIAASLLAMGVYTLRQRGVSAAIEAPILPRPQAAGKAPHLVQAGLDAQPQRPDAARPYPRSYVVLLSRSIFAANGVPSRHSSGAAASTTPLSAATLGLSLKGITQEDSRFTAFVEDTSAKKFLEVRVGDAIGTGRVCDITLHDLTYEVSGNRLRLEIDNVSGQSGPPPVIKTRADGDNGNGSAQEGQQAKKKRKKSQS